jgi:uridine kinase
VSGPRSEPLVAGIAGPSCSGKTSLAVRLVERLAPGAARLPLDAYYRDLSDLPPELRATNNFDHPDAVDRDLLLRQVAALAAGEPIEMPVYRFASHTRAPHGIPTAPPRLLIVEGLFALYWDELLDLLHARVYVDCDESTCLARRLRRDVLERGRTAESVRAQFERSVRPMGRRFVLPTRSRATLVVDGAGDPEVALARILALLRRPPLNDPAAPA